MTTRIVTGVDASETAAEAARTAARLALSLGAELHVLSAYGKFEVERFKAGGDEFVYSSEGDALSVANEVTALLRSEFPDLKVHTAAAVGQPAEAIVRAADELDADLIVVGNKRVQGLSRVLGSIASEIAHKAHCDVYIAHTHHR